MKEERRKKDTGQKKAVDFAFGFGFGSGFGALALAIHNEPILV